MPEDKLQNAREAVSLPADVEVLALVDLSCAGPWTKGGAKYPLIITADGLHYKNKDYSPLQDGEKAAGLVVQPGVFALRFSEIKSIKACRSGTCKLDNVGRCWLTIVARNKTDCVNFGESKLTYFAPPAEPEWDPLVDLLSLLIAFPVVWLFGCGKVKEEGKDR